MKQFDNYSQLTHNSRQGNIMDAFLKGFIQTNRRVDIFSF